MSQTVNLQQRIQQLKRLQADLPSVMKRTLKDATIRAVETATNATPPKAGTGRSVSGTNTLSSGLKQHWDSDSQKEPQEIPGGYQTILANDLKYASYVDQGHRMDRHFVRGLYINRESGLLEMDRTKDVGIVVGTKTKFVKGEFIVDKAKETFHQTLESELDKEIQRLMR